LPAKAYIREYDPPSRQGNTRPQYIYNCVMYRTITRDSQREGFVEVRNKCP